MFSTAGSSTEPFFNMTSGTDIIYEYWYMPASDDGAEYPEEIVLPWLDEIPVSRKRVSQGAQRVIEKHCLPEPEPHRAQLVKSVSYCRRRDSFNNRRGQ